MGKTVASGDQNRFAGCGDSQQLVLIRGTMAGF
jgi:hypothetical protein